jgi:microcin C transport system substrate-binding protein
MKSRARRDFLHRTFAAALPFGLPHRARAAPGGDAPPTARPGPQPSAPKSIKWETNNEDPPIGSPQAQRGGMFRFGLGSYPLTFRLMGPNANDAFASWNRAFTMDFGLVARHPVTDRFIPWMATHWSVQDDRRTVHFKLDPDARFSDGKPVTADDYVFTWQMMLSEHIVDPFYTTYAQRYFESVDRIDDYTLRIVGTRPSWRPLSDYGLWPTPKHAVVLDKDWVTRTNNEPQITVGPYVIDEIVRGESVTFRRLPNWWGEGKRYFRGLWNFERIHLPVIPAERELDFLRRGAVDMIVESTARRWNEEYTFDAVQNGWIRRERVFIDVPTGINGMHMNLEAPLFRNKDFRKAMQHLFNFERLNRNLMFSAYYRVVSFFEGTEYANPKLKPYAFDPSKAIEYLERAGYRRPPQVRASGVLGMLSNMARGLIFARTDTEDILVNDAGEKASFSLIYGSRGLEPHLTVMQQEFRRAGVDMRLRLLEPGTAFERGLERKYEMTFTGRTSGFYPDPRQYLGTEFKKTTNNNDIWGFGTAEVDGLIKIYEEDFDFEARRQAMYRIDEIVHEEAFYIPFWTAPYIRIAHWDYLRFPDFYLPRRTEQVTDYLVYWIDAERQKALADDMRAGRAYPLDRDIDKDYYGIRERLKSRA